MYSPRGVQMNYVRGLPDSGTTFGTKFCVCISIIYVLNKIARESSINDCQIYGPACYPVLPTY